MVLLSVMLLKFSVEQRFFIKASKGYLLIQEITGTTAILLLPAKLRGRNIILIVLAEITGNHFPINRIGYHSMIQFFIVD
ncbi:MAG: hypothetical protein D3905_17135 [Candidatus Electrothrix sp. AS4_5]|nr:hypothetical protein [Candidatus Electrothrix gigas]MCI5191467.1 hypothetical protein [Candidatus Electrothrix gigas]